MNWSFSMWCSPKPTRVWIPRLLRGPFYRDTRFCMEVRWMKSIFTIEFTGEKRA